MKISNRQLEAFGASDTAKRLYAAKFPVKYGWKLKLQREALQGAAKALGESKTEVIMRHCRRDDRGEPVMDEGRYSFRGEGATRFAAEFDELLGQELEVPTERVDIPEAVLDAAGGWSADDLVAFEPFINIVAEAGEAKRA